MELVTKKKLQLYTGRAHPALAADIAESIGVELGDTNLREFANGEIHCRFGQSLRGADVFIIQTHGGKVNHSIMEQLIMIDAAKRASAKRITAVCPYYGYSRQDRKAEGREPITAKLVADMLQAAGAARVVSVDLLDDMIDTAGTICAAADILVEHGASDVWVMATHAVLSDPATDRLKNSSAISRVVVTDTLPLTDDKLIDKLEVLSVAGLVANAIDAVFEDTSVSEIFGGENQK